MRSATSAALCAALALAGCGNYSNEDLVFLAALPDREALRVVVPRDASQALCGALGESEVWLGARQTGDSINGAVDGLLQLVDLVRSIPPGNRGTDLRTWGPWGDAKHPGVETRVWMQRQRAAKPEDDVFAYLFEQRSAATDWVAVVDGYFRGTRAAGGAGVLALHFDAAWTLGTAQGADPRGDALFAFDHASDPRTLEMVLRASSGFGLKPSFAYTWTGWADGFGRFDFYLLDARKNELTVQARFTPQGAGRAEVGVRTPLGFTGSLSQCWDAQACLSWLDDPLGITQPLCGPQRPCALGSAGACPQVR